MFEPNPFSPGKRLTQPELFAGRRQQLELATRVLVQAANHKVRHALVTGERGIGKSSFSSQVQGIARGEANYLSLVETSVQQFPYTFLVVEHIARDGQGVADLTSGLLKELDAVKGLARFARYKFDFTLDLGPFQAAASRKDTTAQDLVVKFVDELQAVATHVASRVNGILLVVDEIDRVAANPGVSTFFKVATELLTARGFENVVFLPVGLVGSLDALKAEHPSVGRIFRPIDVPLLTSEERVLLLEKALAPTSIAISQDAADAIAAMSGGYPNAVHLLGEQAFEIATEDGSGLIGKDTVQTAISAAVAGGAREEFDPRYISIKGRSRGIIRYIAEQDADDVASSQVCAALGVRPTDVSANFDTLLRSDVLVRPEPGVYRLREPLFRECLRYVIRSGDEPVQRRPEKRSR